MKLKLTKEIYNDRVRMERENTALRARVAELEAAIRELVTFVDAMDPALVSPTDYRKGVILTFGHWYDLKSAVAALARQPKGEK